jgi:hypothetical protein
MRFKNILHVFFLSIFISTIGSAADINTREPYQESTREIKGSGNNYSPDFDGITRLMEDLAHKDPATFAKLKEEYDDIASDRQFYRFFGLGLAVGGVMAMIFSRQITGDSSPTNIAAIGGGAAVLGGVSTLFFLPPGQRRIENFLNQHNRHSSGPGLKISFELEPAGSLAGMIRLTIF